MNDKAEKAKVAQEFADQAKALYNNLIRSNSSDPKICDQIISKCEESIKNLPNPDAYSLLSRAIHLKSTNLPKDRERLNLHLLAINYAVNAIEILPQVADFHYWKAELLFEQVLFSQSKQEAKSRLEEAEKEYQTTLEINPNHKGAIEGLKELYNKREKLGNTEIDEDPESLLEFGWECFYKRDWNQLLDVCKKILSIEGLNKEQEASCRKLYANALVGSSFENKENALALRKEAIDHSRKSIDLYGYSAESFSLSEAYDILGTSLQLYSFVTQQESEKDKYFQEGLEAFKKAVSIDPNNKMAVKHLNEAKQAPSSTSQKSGCFIATAVYGSYNSPEVVILRNYSDTFLLPSKLGKIFVQVYYLISPFISSFISHKPYLIKILKKYLLNNIVKLVSKRKER